MMKSLTKDLLDKTVIISNEDGLYLHPDGRTMVTPLTSPVNTSSVPTT